ncbi:PQQ-binding-like beta-propeller repeat protein [Haloarcula litorea]|uniref:outer membrane protein assembly factor BamB family protein n=1 Tax=Haloarcula litorea TaxID=3032579 RepID=UPI0023E831D9|nr:PQQ-binding-like beta-propeller repeat protein [Halomicroarcula sp. GDY20]
MPSRRQFVTAAGAALAALAGCSDDGDPGTERPTTEPPTTGPATDTPGETRTEPEATERDSLLAWLPTWTLDIDLGNALSLRVADGDLYATLSDDASRSAVAAVDRAGDGFRWRAALDGDVVASSYLTQTNARDKWALTVTEDTLYVVAGNTDDYAWTALHALERESGDIRWSLRRERELAVAGVRDGTVVAGARDFFVPESTHDTPEEPLSTALLGVDAATGEVRWSQSFAGVQAATTYAGGVAVGQYDTVTGLDVDGAERWSTATDEPREIVPLADAAVVAAADDDRSTLRAFAPDGTERWRDTRPVESFLADGDTLYGLGDETVAYDADGTVRWRVSGYSDWPLLAPDGETLYARAAVRANAVDAFDVPGGGRRFRWATPSNNGWPAGATDTMAVAEAITPDEADFTSLYAVDDRSGEPIAVYRPEDTVFDVAGAEGTAYAAVGGRLLAFGHP